MDRKLKYQIENTLIIRRWTSKYEKSHDKKSRDEIFVKITHRTYTINKMLVKFLKSHTSYEHHGKPFGYWKTKPEERFLKCMYFFQGTKCNCEKKKGCRQNVGCKHTVTKMMCNLLALQKTGEMYLGHHIFQYLF